MIHYTPEALLLDPELLRPAELGNEWRRADWPDNKPPNDWLYSDAAKDSFRRFCRAYTRYLREVATRAYREQTGEDLASPPDLVLSDEQIDERPVLAGFVLGIIQCEDFEIRTNAAIASEYGQWVRAS